MGAINAKNAKFAKYVSGLTVNGYSCGDDGREINHTREVTGSNPVSPIEALQDVAGPRFMGSSG